MSFCFHKLLDYIIFKLETALYKKDGYKIVEERKVNNISVWTDTGWKPVRKVFKTIKFKIYELKTSNYTLKCADNHIVFKSDLSEVFVKDLKVGDKIKTINGDENVVSIIQTNKLIICMILK